MDGESLVYWTAAYANAQGRWRIRGVRGGIQKSTSQCHRGPSIATSGNGTRHLHTRSEV